MEPASRRAFRIQSRLSFHVRPGSRKNVRTLALHSQGTVHMHSWGKDVFSTSSDQLMNRSRLSEALVALSSWLSYLCCELRPIQHPGQTEENTGVGICLRPRDRDLHGLARKTDCISILNDFYCAWLLNTPKSCPARPSMVS